MVRGMKDSLLMTSGRAAVYSAGKMAVFMTVCGKMESSMVLASLTVRIIKSAKANGSTAKRSAGSKNREQTIKKIESK